MSAETFFTAAYKESPDPPRPEKSQQLRQLLPTLCKSLQIKSVLDCGCGTTGLHTIISDISGVSYLGVDIVKPLITSLQTSETSSFCKFQYMDVFQDPPETADLWIVRDLLNLYPESQFVSFFQNFIASQSSYIAVTSIDTTTENTAGCLGIQRKLNLQAPPYSMPDPLVTLLDGQQWFCIKKLLVFTKAQIASWLSTVSIPSTHLSAEPIDTQDKNAHLTTNIRLRDVKLGGHMGLGVQKLL